MYVSAALVYVPLPICKSHICPFFLIFVHCYVKPSREMMLFVDLPSRFYFRSSITLLRRLMPPGRRHEVVAQ
jgi:hypothetical protein